MKYLLLCVMLLSLCGCTPVVDHPFKNRGYIIGGTGYLVSCELSPPGVEYTVTQYNAITGSQTHAPDTIPEENSTCAQVAAGFASQESSAKSKSGAKAVTSTGQPLEYLLDQASLSVQMLDPTTLSFTQVDLPGGGNTQYPTSMGATADGSALWVTQLAIGPNNAGITPAPPQVSIFNVAQQAFTGSFPLPSGVSPNAIQFSPDGTNAYISNDGSPAEGSSGVAANSSVLMVNVATQTVAKTIPTPKGAGSEALSPDGLLLYTIGNNFGIGSNDLTVVDLTTNTVATSVALPNGGVKIFVNLTGTRLYVVWLRGIDVFDTATLQKVATIPGTFTFLTNFAYFTPDGSTAWFHSGGYGMTYVVDLRSNSVINTIQSTAHGFLFGIP